MMKRWLLLTSIVLSNSQLIAQTGLNLDPVDFADSIDNRAIQLLDVRTASEYKSGFIRTALQADWNNRKQFIDRTQYIDKNKPVYVYCLSGSRSSDAAQWLRKNGWTNVYHLKGGLLAWKKQGLTLEGGQAIQQMSLESYRAAIKSHNIVLVDFGAEWCPPCKKMEPVLAEVQRELQGAYRLLRVDGGNDVDVMHAQQVEALPVFIIYKNGKEVWRKEGIVTKEELLKALRH